MKINFEEFEIYTDISKENKVKGDARESFANIIYTQTNGIKMHALAMKIYQSQGETEYTDDEVQIIENVSNRYAKPNFIDALQEQINQNNKTQEQ